MKKNSTILIITGVAILAIVIGVLWYYLKPKSGGVTTALLPGAGGPAAINATTTTTTSTTTTNDNYPLVKGSSGPNVKYLQQAINRLNPNADLTEDGVFGAKTYTELLLTPGLGTKYYPVTITAFNDLMSKANSIGALSGGGTTTTLYAAH